MLFLDRRRELAVLRSLPHDGGFAVVWGRRRLGKTRLLLEWCEREAGVYTVADQSGPDVQRAYFARAISEALPTFADVTYPDWGSLFARLASDALARGFKGPIVIDELPFLVATSPELPSVLQRWIDHDAKRAGLRVAVAGSSQRMMQGLVLSHDAPLFGRAHVLLDLGGLPAGELVNAFGTLSPHALVEHWTAWGGVPRYWELAAARKGSVVDRVVALVLDHLGPLFSEPERLLLEETPSAIELRPLLDAIGGGAHRLSEIAGRLGRPATSLAHALRRLIDMGLVRREAPYGEPARGGKRSLYKIDDPFLRLWFRVVAPNRAALIAGTAATRQKTLEAHWPALTSLAWEDLCRSTIPTLRGPLAKLGPWQPASRYWHGAEPEWDLVASDISGTRILLGESWLAARSMSSATLAIEAHRLRDRPAPPTAAGRDVVRALFVPAIAASAPRVIDGVHLVTLEELVVTRTRASGR
ncbi:MAG: ATP-binding protein [Kofleriaceae bacterium]